MQDQLVLDRYQPIEVAGEGGFGQVIVAWDTRIQRKVAIKCIELRDTQIDSMGNTISISQQETNCLDSNKTTCFNPDKVSNNNKSKKQVDQDGEHWQDNIPGLNEARTAAMIQDSNIVTVYDFEFHNNMAYIIMEYVDGITLTDFLSKYSKDLTLDIVTCIFAGISGALKVAHEQNVLHLDIKPDNVLIDTKGNVKVTDFGLATLADEFGYGTANAGTIGYMPPEQMRQQSLDVRSDLWALSSITYEMLTGTNPFFANDLKSALNQIYDTKIVAPSNCWEDLNVEINQIVYKGLDPEPTNRYYSVKEFSKDLMKHLGNARAGKKQIVELFDVIPEMVTYQPKNILEENKYNFQNSIWGQILGRGFSAICATCLTLVGCLNIPFFGGAEVLGFAPNIFTWIALAVTFILGCLFPFAGVSLGLIFVSVAMFFYGNFIVGVTYIGLVSLWAIFCGWKKLSHSNCLCLYPFLSAFGFSQMAPFLTGFYNKPKFAAMNSFFGFLICLLFASMGSMSLIGWDPILHANWGSIGLMSGDIQSCWLKLVMNPSVIVFGASWIVSATLTSAFFEFRQRGLRIFGVSLSFVIMLSGLLISAYLSSNMVSFTPEWWQTIPTVIAGCFAIIIAIFKPSREYHNYLSMNEYQAPTDQIN